MVPPMMRIERARAGRLVLVGSLLLGACGDDDGGGGGTPVTAAEGREFYGLVPGTCLVYGFGNQQSQTATMLISEADSVRFPDGTVIWELTVSVPYRRYLRARDTGEVVLLREESRPEGELVQRDYTGEGAVPPLFARLRRAGDEVDFASNDFRTQTARPNSVTLPDGTTDDDPPIADHRWQVLREGVAVGEGPFLESTTEMTYRIERENVSGTATWNFVPNVGFVAFQDFEQSFGGTGNVYLLRDARVCSEDGSCEGSPPECEGL